MRYIGQSKSIEARNRLSNHLIKKDKNTGAKLQFVKQHIEKGGKIKVSHILIEPESLRHYIEEELIKKHSVDLDWNSHTRKKT
jgi:predicted small secreted protein